MGSTHSLICTSAVHRGKYEVNQFLALRILSSPYVTIQKICEQHSLHLCSGPFHEGEYVVNQFLDLTDFIITIIGNNIQCEGERQKHMRFIIVSRVVRFLSPTKLNRYEQTGHSEAHTIQPLCLVGVGSKLQLPL